MSADAVHTMFEEACLRLFALHADGYKRPKPTVRAAIFTTKMVVVSAHGSSEHRLPNRRQVAREFFH